MNARIIAVSALAAVTLSAPAFAQDAAPTGATLYQQRCNACHSGAPTARGPVLKGVAGGKVAAVAGYEYSAGLKAKGGKWTDATLDTYLTDPKAFSGPDGKMAVKIADAAQRKLIIAHLKTLK
jgi:cytochrome c